MIIILKKVLTTYLWSSYKKYFNWIYQKKNHSNFKNTYRVVELRPPWLLLPLFPRFLVPLIILPLDPLKFVLIILVVDIIGTPILPVLPLLPPVLPVLEEPLTLLLLMKASGPLLLHLAPQLLLPLPEELIQVFLPRTLPGTRVRVVFLAVSCPVVGVASLLLIALLRAARLLICLIRGGLPLVFLLVLSPAPIGVASTAPGEAPEALAEPTRLLLPLTSLRLRGLLLGESP